MTTNDHIHLLGVVICALIILRVCSVKKVSKLTIFPLFCRIKKRNKEIRNKEIKYYKFNIIDVNKKTRKSEFFIHQCGSQSDDLNKFLFELMV